MDKVLGIDISKAKIDVALLQDGKYKQAEFSNNKDGYRRLRRWLKKHKALGCHAALEATGRYGDAVAEFLHEQGHPVSVLNPAAVKLYGDSRRQRHKTDKEDAQLIAHYCQTQEPALWQPPSPEVKELQALTRHLKTLKEDRVRLLNRRSSGVASATVLAALNNSIELLDKQIKQFKQAILTHINQHKTLKKLWLLLISIPGIGPTTAAIFLAEVPDISRFNSAAQLAAYAGLCPRHHQSGSSVRKRSRLDKRGNVRLRSIFFYPALSAMRHNPLVATFAERLTARGKEKMTVVAASMRKLLHIAFGVLKTQREFDPNYLVNSHVPA